VVYNGCCLCNKFLKSLIANDARSKNALWRDMVVSTPVITSNDQIQSPSVSIGLIIWESAGSLGVSFDLLPAISRPAAKPVVDRWKVQEACRDLLNGPRMEIQMQAQYH
jgi:hypothetical protein